MTTPYFGCITCEFTRAEHRRLASELALLREILRALCGGRAEEIIRLMESRVRAVTEGPFEFVEDLDRRFNLCLAVAVAESMMPLIAQLGKHGTLADQGGDSAPPRAVP